MLNNAITPLNNAITTIKQRYNNAITMVNNDSSFKYYFNSCFNRGFETQLFNGFIEHFNKCLVKSNQL